MSENEENNATLLGEIEQGPSKFEQFLERNQKKLMVLGVALALGVAGYIVFDGMGKNKGLAASADFIDAHSASELQDVVASQQGTPAAGSALLTLANTQWSAGEKAASIESLESFISDYSEHDAYSAALISLSTKLISEGKSDEVKTYLDEVIEIEDGCFAPIAKNLQAEIALHSGNTEEAVSILEGLESMGGQELGNLQGLVNRNLQLAKSPVPTKSASMAAPEVSETSEPVTQPTIEAVQQAIQEVVTPAVDTVIETAPESN